MFSGTSYTQNTRSNRNGTTCWPFCTKAKAPLGSLWPGIFIFFISKVYPFFSEKNYLLFREDILTLPEKIYLLCQRSISSQKYSYTFALTGRICGGQTTQGIALGYGLLPLRGVPLLLNHNPLLLNHNIFELAKLEYTYFADEAYSRVAA